MSNTTDAESDTDIIYRVDCCGVQFELVPARCFFAPSLHHPRRQSLVMKTDRPQLASGQSRIVEKQRWSLTEEYNPFTEEEARYPNGDEN